jgi:DNA-binding transcriptional regulator YdaS (Cro superfamily)
METLTMEREVPPSRQSYRGNPDVAERLRAAVRRGGGNKRVAATTGIPLGSINNYMRARNKLPASTAAKIAAACGVNTDWILMGEGPMERPPAASAAPTIEAARQPEITEFAPKEFPDADPDRKLARTLDLDRLGAAMRVAAEIVHRPIKAEDWHRLAEVTTLLYDELTAQAQRAAKEDLSEP